jgi:hypothetical protein
MPALGRRSASRTGSVAPARRHSYLVMCHSICRFDGGIVMWICPKCTEEMEPGFDTCWNCGTSRTGEENPDFEPEEVPIGATGRDVECLRCGRALDYLGLKHFHEGARWGVFGDLGELLVRIEDSRCTCAQAVVMLNSLGMGAARTDQQGEVAGRVDRSCSSGSKSRSAQPTPFVPRRTGRRDIELANRKGRRSDGQCLRQHRTQPRWLHGS